MEGRLEGFGLSEGKGQALVENKSDDDDEDKDDEEHTVVESLWPLSPGARRLPSFSWGSWRGHRQEGNPPFRSLSRGDPAGRE